MKKLFILSMMLLLLTAPLSVLAQGPGEGGPIIEGTSGLANISSLNPLRCTGVDCQRLYLFMFPAVIGADPTTGDFASSDVSGASLAQSWEVSEDGLEYTFHLRDDMFWTDGEPVTAEDVKFTYDAIASGEIESDFSGYVDAYITGVEVIDDYTVKMIYGAPTCTALNVAAYPVVPAHAFESFADMVEHEFDTAPSITAGPFAYDSTIEGQQINLRANQDYPDAENGVIPQGFIFVDVPDQVVQVERFLSGEMNFIEDPQFIYREDVRGSGQQVFDYAGNSWTYMGLNLANPENPQSAYDEAGNLVEQEPHPILGDVRVRRALQEGIDVNGIVDATLYGGGTQMAANELPTSWAVDPDLTPIPFDQAAAGALLDEAGWTDEDGDGVRECHGCMYAEEGTPLELELITNEDNTQRVDVGVIIQDQLRPLGVQINFQAYDFNTVIDQIINQTFDAVIIGWSNSYPVDPDLTQIFSSQADAVGAGFNFTSYVNPEFDALSEQGVTLAGCDTAARAEIYHQIQEILQRDQPYVWLYAENGMYAAGTGVSGFSPYANQPFWNVQDWAISN